MAPVIQELMRRNLDFKFVLTGQHAETMYDLIDSFELCQPDDSIIKPKETDTKVKVGSWFFRALLEARKKKDYFNKSSIILVHGDTLSTLLGAIIGRLKGSKVAHIEAGLRSFNLFHPFPEEITRLLVSRLAHYFFCPDDWSANNLKQKKHVYNTQSNTILDSYRFALQNHHRQVTEQKSYAVASIHRFENINNDERFNFIMEQIAQASEKINIKFVLHPVTKNKINNSPWRTKLEHLPGITLTKRMTYIEFTHLLLNARFLISDGGSNQEEASIMGIPCLLMREATERQDGLQDNIVLSKYRPEVIRQFINDHCDAEWEIRTLPEIYPSYSIINTLSQLEP
jgi:UDP-N-acetylglucosamine 2-epimerase (non-hydrolysing)